MDSKYAEIVSKCRFYIFLIILLFCHYYESWLSAPPACSMNIHSEMPVVTISNGCSIRVAHM